MIGYKTPARLTVDRERERRSDTTSAQRVVQLEQELTTLREQYDAEVQGLLAVIEELRQVPRISHEQAAVSIALGVPAPRLDGERILVVGVVLVELIVATDLLAVAYRPMQQERATLRKGSH